MEYRRSRTIVDPMALKLNLTDVTTDRMDRQGVRQVDIDSILKFEEAFNSMHGAFQLYDSVKDGCISKSDFRRVLAEFGFQIGAAEFDIFLGRVGVRASQGQLSYTNFLDKFQNRTKGSISNRFLSSRNYLLNRNQYTTKRDLLRADELEARLVDYMHSDIIKLFQDFQNFDEHNLGVVTQYDFRAVIEKKIGYKLTQQQWESVKSYVGLESDGLMNYMDFLDRFDIDVRHWDGFRNPVQTQITQRVANPTVALPAPRFEDIQNPRSLENRSSVDIQLKLEEFFTSRQHVFDKHFQDMDRRKTGRINKAQFGALLRLCSLHLTQHELDKFWSTLDVTRDGLITYNNLVNRFSVPGKRLFDNANTYDAPRPGRMQRSLTDLQSKKVSFFSNRSSNSKLDQILERSRPRVEGNWENIKGAFRAKDSYGCGSVTSAECRHIFDHFGLCHPNDDRKNVMMNFDFDRNGRFHYLPFLRTFVDQENQSIQSKLSHHLQQRLIKEQRNLRSAFKRADINNDGYLQVSEFRRVIRACGIPANDEDIYHILSFFDTDMDGRISYKEFLNAILNV